MLDTGDHRRDSLGLQYVYAVNSRRSGGLSIGINLNPNNACNWQCIYCQVEGLVRGSAPAIDVDALERELHAVIGDILDGEFCARHGIDPALGVIRDIAISGNGEPTTSREFDRVVEVIERAGMIFPLPEDTRVVLITNGSLVHQPGVQNGIARLAGINGEVWFKLDSATKNGIESINKARLPLKRVRKNLETAAALCPLWIQTCVFAHNGKPPSDAEQQAYLDFLSGLVKDGVGIRGVHLYGIARPSMQPEATSLSRLPREWLERYADRIRETGAAVTVSA